MPRLRLVAAEGSTLVSTNTDQHMDISDPIPAPSPCDPQMEATPISSETDYGPWLLVTRRRGRARDRGGSTHADLATSGAAADSSAVVTESRGAPPRNIRGESRFKSSGRCTGPKVLYDKPPVPQTSSYPSPSNDPFTADPLIENSAHDLDCIIPSPNVSVAVTSAPHFNSSPSIPSQNPSSHTA